MNKLLISDSGEIFDIKGTWSAWENNKVDIISSCSIDKIDEIIPKKIELISAYPNPFNPVTKVKFSIPKEQHVKLSIYDSKGLYIDELLNSQLSSGFYEIEWDASSYPSGIYFLSLSSSNDIYTKKIILLK